VLRRQLLFPQPAKTTEFSLAHLGIFGSIPALLRGSVVHTTVRVRSLPRGSEGYREFASRRVNLCIGGHGHSAKAPYPPPELAKGGGSVA